jgi:uncharacterized delta-60 repeat protein
VAGYTNSFGAGHSDFWILKLNSDGTVAWQKTYGGSDDEEAYSIQQTSDGGYIVAGTTTPMAPTNYDFWVLKLNSDGTVAWQKTYGGSGNEFLTSIQQTQDGGYIVAGWSDSSGAGSYDLWVLKLNPDGSIAWQKTYGGPYIDRANSVQQTSDGGYIAAGETSSGGEGNYAWVLKLNSDGSIAWQKTYRGDIGNSFNSIQQTQDGGYVVAGSTGSSYSGGNDYDLWVLKLNSDGSTDWAKAYEEPSYGNEVARSIQQTSDGGYIVVGFTGDKEWPTPVDSWVLKLNSDGTIIWQRAYDRGDIESASSVQQTSDGGYIVAGWADDVWVLKLRDHGDMLGCSHTTNADDSFGCVVVGDTQATVQNTSAIPFDTSISPQAPQPKHRHSVHLHHGLQSSGREQHAIRGLSSTICQIR